MAVKAAKKAEPTKVSELSIDDLVASKPKELKVEVAPVVPAPVPVPVPALPAAPIQPMMQPASPSSPRVEAGLGGPAAPVRMMPQRTYGRRIMPQQRPQYRDRRRESYGYNNQDSFVDAPPYAEASVGAGRRPFEYLNGGSFAGVVDNRVLPDAGLPTEEVEGILDNGIEGGHGVLRPKFIPTDSDIYISTSQIKRFGLRPGDRVTGPARRPKENERYWGLLMVEKVNGKPPIDLDKRPRFGDLTPIFPKDRLTLETGPDPLANRMIDLVAPIGRGQRGMIVSPPKAGKTTIMKDMATGVAKNFPEIHLMAVLIGERPEEVTDIRRHIESVTGGKGEVIASNFDERAEDQTKSAEIALERAKRLVEEGNHVFILLDSITRLARAYNLAIPTSGRTLSGGFDPAALYPPKRFFGAARNFEEAGSLTIIGTALVDTGSRMDDLVYEEFKGTGNMELVLDRRLADRRIFPSIDIQRSGTRKEELLFSNSDYQSVVLMRRMLDVLNDDERSQLVIDKMKKHKSNKEFLASLKEG